MGEHTPLVVLNIAENGPKIYEHVNEGAAVCQFFDKNGNAFPDADAHAAFIVKACNAHEDLMKALEPFAAITDFSPIGDGKIDRVMVEVSIQDIRAAQSAIAKAKP